MISSSELNKQTVKVLCAVAKEEKISSWHELRKSALINALLERFRGRSDELLAAIVVQSERLSLLNKNALVNSVHQKKPRSSKPKANSPEIVSLESLLTPPEKIVSDTAEISSSIPSSPLISSETLLPTTSISAATSSKTLKNTSEQTSQETDVPKLGTAAVSASSGKKGPRDYLVLMVCDPFWLHAYWELSSALQERIRAAMGHLWHTSCFVLRLYRMQTESDGITRQQFVQDIAVRKDVNNWYLDVQNPPSAFVVELGYLTPDRQFYTLISSNRVETPMQHLQNIHQSFNSSRFSSGRYDPYRYPASPNSPNSFADGQSGYQDTMFTSENNGRESRKPRLQLIDESIELNINVELIIQGKTVPGASLQIKDNPIRVHEDGSFMVRYHMPEKRHVFPIVAVSQNGLESVTTILAIERNTKKMEKIIRENESDSN